jgi:hypothetical protein
VKDTESSKSVSDTPETDAMLDNQSHDDVKWDDACDQLAELCRSLERERNEAREALRKLTNHKLAPN